MIFREARRADVAAVVALLKGDVLGKAREVAPESAYLAAFARVRASGSTTLIVGEEGGRVVATYQLSVLPGLSRGGVTRGIVEGVRVAASLRGQGIGRAMMADAATRARAAGCGLLSLTTDRSRADAHRFYEACGFTASHTGFKRVLD